MNRVDPIAPAAAAEAANSGSHVYSEFGKLPEWNLNDLYPGMASDDFKRDFDSAIEKARGFEKTYKGKLSKLLAEGGDGLAHPRRGLANHGGAR